MKFNWPILFRRVLFLVAILFVALTSPNWAQATLYIFLGSVYFFRSEIADLLIRFKSIGKDGIDTYPQGQMQVSDARIDKISDMSESVGHNSQRVTINTERMEALENYGKEYSTIEEQIERVKNDLELSYPKGEQDKISLLLRHTATLQFLLWCEGVYEVIFGSQIHLLKLLASSQRSYSEVEGYFGEIKKLFPDTFKEWNMAGYLHFLIERGLIQLDDTINYQITERGKNFLKWLISSNKNLKIGNL